MSDDLFVGVNWGSTNFRAYLLDGSTQVLDAIETPDGVTRLDRAGMALAIRRVVERWPRATAIHASGMIGSNVGWADAGYVECPARVEDLAGAGVAAEMGGTRVRITPGLACRRAFDGGVDVMRGEETELFGLLALEPASTVVALPGTHTKWVRTSGGRVVDFLTCMSGEIFDRMTSAGLLASIVEGEAAAGPVFLEAVDLGRSRDLGLGSRLFNARARVMRGELSRADAASWIRGLLLGSEIADAMAFVPEMAEAGVTLVGSEAVCALYAAALDAAGVPSRTAPSRQTVARGFRCLHHGAAALA